MSSINSTKLAYALAAFHISIVVASNFLVQFPLDVFGFKSTWGAISFPFIFLATDLTVRVFGAHLGRRIIFYAMLPALFASYLVTSGFESGQWLGWGRILTFNMFVFRIAIASFSAYVIGQILDVFVFNKLRHHKQWWHAPVASAIFGNFMDALTFSVIAMYKTSDPYLADNWIEIGVIDYVFKIIINVIFFLPLYKIILTQITRRLQAFVERQNTSEEKEVALQILKENL